MVSSKPNTARRREVRRSVPRPGWAWLHALRNRRVIGTALCVVLFVTLAAVIGNSGRKKPRFEVGQVVPRAIIARVKFRAINTEETEKNRITARQRQRALYVPNEAYFRQLGDSLRELGNLGSDPNTQSLDSIAEDQRKRFALTPENFAALRKYMAGEQPLAWSDLVRQLTDELLGIAALSDRQANKERSPETLSPGITIAHPNLGELERDKMMIIGVPGDAFPLRVRLTELLGKFPAPLRPLIMHVLTDNPREYYVIDQEATDRRRQEAYEAAPLAETIYLPNSVLIPAGKTIDRDLDLKLLEQERQAYLESLSRFNRALLRVGQLGLLALVGIGLWAYIIAYNPRIARNPVRGLTLTGLLLLGQLMAVSLTHVQPTMTSVQPNTIYATAIFPTLLVTIILAIAYDQRFALAIGSAHVLLVVLSLDLPIGFAMIMLTGMAVSAYQLNEVRTRSKLVTVGVWTGLAMSAVTCLHGMAQDRVQIQWQIQDVIEPCLIVLATGLVTGLFVQGILPGIERLFKVTTSMTLKELNDASHPLLRRLAQDAPGTYQHSLRIADMAEAAAEAIGANALLCRVGAMYHDIGKINKPMYFVENQGGGPNRHHKLSPAMSLLIIVGHVKDGIEMAREHRLPVELRHFIESHHGTTLVEYFYHAARKQKEAQADTLPAEFEFRYPGPKPQTREAAIMMICDGVEGAARAIDEPTPVRLEQLVHAMASKRLMDGQFDECSLTLQDLHLIEGAITRTLCAIYHSRIKYPQQDKPSPAAGDGDEQSPATAAS